MFDALFDFVRRTPRGQRVLLGLFLAVCIAFGGSKNGATNGTALLQLVPTNPTVTLNLGVRVQSDFRPPVTAEDIIRGWQLCAVRTNGAMDYAMPEGATLATNWWMRGAYEDVRLESLPFAFPVASTAYDSVWAFTWGKLRPRLRDTSNELVSVGAPMSAIPNFSRFWTAPTTNDSYLLTWEDFALGRIPVFANASSASIGSSLLVSAQIELAATGDFVMRSNEVEKVYRHMDDFDWDGDGIVNEDDEAPYEYDGDHCGQPSWWRAHVDEMVGSGLENGYYRLLATVPSDGFRRCLLTVGNERVVVAEPGEYVFLLEKGADYALSVTPFNANVAFDVTDDLPAVSPILMLGGWETSWTVDGGLLSLQVPTFDRAGTCCWLPTFRATPELTHLGPGDSPQTFRAVLSDYAYGQDVAYSWSSSEGNVWIGSPESVETEIGVSVMPNWAAASVSVTAKFGRHELVSSCSFTYGSHSQPEVSLVLAAPSALLLNSNNVDSAKSGHISVSLVSDVPTNGILTLSCVSGGGCVTSSGSRMWQVTDSVSHTIEVAGIRTSAALNDVVFRLVFAPGGGSSITSTASLTVVQVNDVVLPGAPADGLVVSTGTSVALDVEVLPATAKGLLSTVFDVRRLCADGTYANWQYAAGNYAGTDALYNPTEGGIYQVRALVGVGWGAQDERHYVWDEDEQLDIGPGRKGAHKSFGVCDEEWQKTLRNCAKAFLGSTAYLEESMLPAGFGFAAYPPNTYKCNVFVAHRAEQAGLVFPALHGRIVLRYPPTANEMANPLVFITSWPALSEGIYPQPGFVAASAGVRYGHCGIVDFDGCGISAGRDCVNRWMEAMAPGALLRRYTEDNNE